MTEELTTDVCIVGGGPAGLTLALLLARSGVDVVVLERSPLRNREFWGEILQPGGLAVLDALGVLDRARARGGHELTRFQFVEDGAALLDIDYGALPGPHNYLLSLPQRHLLAALLDAASRYDHLDHRDRYRATGLVREGGRVCGVVARGAHGETRVRARHVVGADGRFSAVRRLAGIGNGREDVFDFDVLWVRVPAEPDHPRYARIFRNGGSPLLAYPSWPDHLQLGWTVPHAGYGRLLDDGVDRLRDRLAAAAPPYAELIAASVTGPADFSLLDVFAACAPRWGEPGLVLIGDSAHTHSPIGAQGINLAVQDAAVLHPLLVAELRGAPGVEPAAEFERARRPDIARMMRIQTMQARGMRAESRVARLVRRRATRALVRTPLFARVTREIVHGNPRVRVASELFTTS